MTGQTTGDFAQLLLGLSMGALLTMAVAMLRAPRRTVRWSGFLFFSTSAVFALKLWCDQTHALPVDVRIIIGPIAMSSVGWFWLLVMALFGDCDEFRPAMYLAPAALFVVALMHNLSGAFMPVIWVVSTVLQAGFAIAALVVVLRSWKGDLVETRRQVRGPFMVAVALYILSLNGFDIWAIIGDTPAWYPMFNAAMLTLCVLAGAMTFLEARGQMFGEAAEPVPVRQPPAEADLGADGGLFPVGDGAGLRPGHKAPGAVH